MPSIETMYSQSDRTTSIEKMGEKHEVGLILSDKCLRTEISQSATNGTESGVKHTDDEVSEAEECKAGEVNESVIEGDHEETDDTDHLVVVKIEIHSGDSGDCQTEQAHPCPGDQEEAGGKTVEGEGKEGESQEERTLEGSHDESRDMEEKKRDLDKIWEKICPGYNSARSKKLKAKLSEVLEKCRAVSKPREGVRPAKSNEKRDEPDLSEKFHNMFLKDDEGTLKDDEGTLKSKGPGMRGGMGVSDMPGQYSPSYAHSPGQFVSMSSPLHDSMATFTNIGDMKGSATGLVNYFPQSNMSYYPVSPPQPTLYQTGLSVSDVDSIHSAQSPDDELQDIPTVMATAMQVIVPGQLEPTQRNQTLIDSWRLNNVPSSVPSPHSVDYDVGASSRDFDEQGWPEPSPPSSLHCNPPSVSSASDTDSVFSYNAAMSPAGSTGSMVHSPAAPQRYPQGSPHQMTEYRTTSSTNSNFGFVQVNRSSTSSCPSPPQENSEDTCIQKIVDFLKESERMQYSKDPKAQPPPAYMSPPDPHREPQQQQNTIPSIQTFLPHNEGCIRPTRSAPTRPCPYPRRPPSSENRAPVYDHNCTYVEQQSVRVNQTPMYVPPSPEYEQHSRSGDTSIYPTQPQPLAFTQYQQWAQTLTMGQLIERDTNDPYEGENNLQKLILNQMSERAIAVIHRMAQLGLDLNATNDQRQSSLLLAVINNMPLVVMALVEYNTDALLGDSKGTYPIHYAASHGFVNVIEYLSCRSSGANLNELDFNGKTPLMCAVEAHRTEQRFYEDGEEVIRLVDNRKLAMRLIELGAQPTKQDASSGKTALHYAISEVKLDMIEIILEGDQSLEVARVAMSDGNTPLHLAVALKYDQENKCKIIRYLVSRGADISATNVEKSKPLDYVTVGHTQVKECLERFSKNNRKR